MGYYHRHKIRFYNQSLVVKKLVVGAWMVKLLCRVETT